MYSMPHGKVSSLYQKVHTHYLDQVRLRFDSIRNRRPQPLTVLESRSWDKYQDNARIIANLNSNWLRSEWFAKFAANRNQLTGFCWICQAWSRFEVDHKVCSEWEGWPIPWWSNTLTCRRCRFDARKRASMNIVVDYIKPNIGSYIYITEQVTPYYSQLSRRFDNIVGSEFLDDGTQKGWTSPSGIRCEDLTNLSFADKSFDYVLCFEVFEHILDYHAALRDCARVLRPSGSLVCSVPFHGEPHLIVRARVMPDGRIEHLLPPEIHGNPLSPDGSLCYYHFGVSFLEDLRKAGFSDAVALLYWSRDLVYLGEHRVVFVARR